MKKHALAGLVALSFSGCMIQESLTCFITTVGQTEQLPAILAELERINTVEGAVLACADFVSIQDGQGRQVTAERDGLLDAANLIDVFSPRLRELSLFLARRSSTMGEKTFGSELLSMGVDPSELTTAAGRDRIRRLIADRAPVYALHARFTAASTATRSFCRRAYQLREQATVTTAELTALMEMRAGLVGRYSELRSIIDGPTFREINANACGSGEGEEESVPLAGTIQASRAPTPTDDLSGPHVLEIVETSRITLGR